MWKPGDDLKCHSPGILLFEKGSLSDLEVNQQAMLVSKQTPGASVFSSPALRLTARVATPVVFSLVCVGTVHSPRGLIFAQQELS